MKIENLINKVIEGDCIDIMKKIPDESIDLIFADPPYFLQLKNSLVRPNTIKKMFVKELTTLIKNTNKLDDETITKIKKMTENVGVKEKYGQILFNEIISFTKNLILNGTENDKIVSLVRKKFDAEFDKEVDAVKDVWDKFKNFEDYDIFLKKWLSECQRILKKTGTIWVIGSYHNIYRMGKTMQDLGFWFLNDIVWVKTNPLPHFAGVRFCNAHETLIWAKKNEKAKGYTFNYKLMKKLNQNKQMRSDWYFPLCNGKERIKDKNGNKLHSTQKPEVLLERILLACTKEDDIVLDPFAGSGSTAAVAKKLKRKYIVIEKDEKYIPYIKSRLDKIVITKRLCDFNF